MQAKCADYGRHSQNLRCIKSSCGPACNCEDSANLLGYTPPDYPHLPISSLRRRVTNGLVAMNVQIACTVPGWI